MLNGKNAGFTLKEIIVVILIVGLVAVVCLPTMQHHHRDNRGSWCRQNMAQIHKSITMYESDYSMYPTMAAKGKNVYTDGDAQEALGLLYRSYTDDVRIFSCPFKPLSPAFLIGIKSSTEPEWPGANGTSFKQAAPGAVGYSTSYGYSPGHTSQNSRVVILADRQGTGPLGNSDNHGNDAGQNVLTAGGAVMFSSGTDGRKNKLGLDDANKELMDSDIYTYGDLILYPEWDTGCR